MMDGGLIKDVIVVYQAFQVEQYGLSSWWAKRFQVCPKPESNTHLVRVVINSIALVRSFLPSLLPLFSV
jgi:hypothetical protein